jgi:hypothetical protein
MTDDEIAQKVAEVGPKQAPAKPAKPRKLLVYTRASGYYHDSIPLAAKVVQAMGRQTGAYEAVITDDPAQVTPENLKNFDAIFMDSTTGNCFLPAKSKDSAELKQEEVAKKALLEFVSGGKGLIGCHAATDCYYGWKEYGDMMGGYFISHIHRKVNVKMDDPKSPLTAMFEGKNFDISDEIYFFKDPYSREKLHLLLSLDVNQTPGFDPGKGKRADEDYAISWIHPYGKGRVFYCSFGHDDPVWFTPAVLAHYLAGIQYAMGDLKADAKASAKPATQTPATP